MTLFSFTDRPMRLGTRRSSLALAQSGHVARWLEEAHPGLRVELVPIITRGDRLPGDLSAAGGKGLFTQELEERLLDGRLDLAVHSLKDLPVTLPHGLGIAAYPKRADPRDALVSDLGASLEELPSGTTLLTGASRRRSQILHLRSDLEVLPVRGNVETRLRKWRSSGAGAVVLATAGLVRLGIQDQPIHPIDPNLLVPAPGQGVLAVQTLTEGPATSLCHAIDHQPTRWAADSERRLVALLGADCALPLAAWAQPTGGRGVELSAVVALPDGSRLVRAHAVSEDPATAATICAESLTAQGAQEILDQLRKPA